MTDRLLGLALIILGIVSIPVCGNDGTAAALLVPIGILGLIIPADGGDEDEEDNGRR